MQHWCIVTSADNFRHDRETLHFQFQGVPHRYRKQVQSMRAGDRVVYYITGLQKFGATATVTGEYFHDDRTRLWTDTEEIWPSRCPSRPDIVLQDDELVDAKKLVPNLAFIEKKEFWGAYFQGSIKTMSEDDFRLIESEMRKAAAERGQLTPTAAPSTSKKTESAIEDMVMDLPLQCTSLHDRLGEMLETIGSWMDFNTQPRHKIYE